MDREGCALSRLTRRVAETPPDFLEEPLQGASGRVAVAALVGDLCRSHGVAAPVAALEAFAGDVPAARNHLRVVLVSCWLLADTWFGSVGLPSAPLLSFLGERCRELSEHVAADKLVTDPDRREELVRLSLAHLGFRPEGETRAQAEDRLNSLSAVERARVLEASRAAEARARAVREALARKAAEESADKYTRE